jgi:hypothetical protein
MPVVLVVRGWARLTVRQFSQLCMCWVFTLYIERVPGSFHKGAFWRTRENKVKGGKWQEAYLLHFLDD